MSEQIEIAYVIVATSCAIISIVFQWRKHARETKTARLHEQEQIQNIRDKIQSQIIDLLVVNLLPIRMIYVHLSGEERLRRELELIFSKPQEIQAISTRFRALNMLQSYSHQLRRIRTAQTLLLVIGLLAVIGALLPLTYWLQDKPVEYNIVNQVALTITAVTVIVFVATIIMRSILERQVKSIAKLI